MPIEVKKLTHVYMPGTPFESRALNAVSLSIQDGEFVGIIGHTGSGKSTLITHLNGLEKSEPGVVFVNGMDLGEKGADLIAIRRVVGLVFQYPEYQLFEETVAKDVAFGPTNLGLDADEIKRRVEHALKQVGLDPAEVSEKSPFELSGGQKRRVAIAGVLAMQPECIVFDEPTAMLDPSGRAEILKIIRGLHEEGKTVILITHFMEEAAEADRIIIMEHGKVHADGTPAQIFSRDDLGVLALPFAVKMAKRLRQSGIDVPADIVTDEQLADFLCSKEQG